MVWRGNRRVADCLCHGNIHRRQSHCRASRRPAARDSRRGRARTALSADRVRLAGGVFPVRQDRREFFSALRGSADRRSVLLRCTIRLPSLGRRVRGGWLVVYAVRRSAPHRRRNPSRACRTARRNFGCAVLCAGGMLCALWTGTCLRRRALLSLALETVSAALAALFVGNILGWEASWLVPLLSIVAIALRLADARAIFLRVRARRLRGKNSAALSKSQT